MALRPAPCPVWLLLAPRRLPEHVREAWRWCSCWPWASWWSSRRCRCRRCPRFLDGTGPAFAGNVFPFCFITIACGAISGFHSLIEFRHDAEDDRQGEPMCCQWATAACRSKASWGSWR
jgi:carbon starvation protein CstA